MIPTLRAEEFWSLAGLSKQEVVLGPVGDFEVAPLLGWREVVTRKPEKGDSVIAVVGQDPFASLADVATAISSYPVGVDVLVLVTGDVNEFCRPANMKKLAEAHINISQVAALAYPDMRLGVVFHRTKSRAGASAEELRAQILTSAFGGIYSALRESEEVADDLLKTLGGRESLDSLRAEHARLARELELSRSRSHALSTRLDHVEASATWRVGALVTQVARDPRKIWSSLRAGLAIWRNRRSRVRSSASSASGAPLLDGDQLLGNYILHGMTHATVLALIGSKRTLKDLSKKFAIVTLAPHDAIAKLESVRPNFLVIVNEPDLLSSVWCYLGGASALDKEQAVLAAIERARALGVKTIFLNQIRSSQWQAVAEASDFAITFDARDELTSAIAGIVGRAKVSA